MTFRLPLLTLFGIFIIQLAQAQFRYRYSQGSSTYIPLTGATSVNGTTIWDDEDYSIPMPFSWKLDSFTTMSTIELFQSESFFPLLVDQTGNTTNQTGFLFCDADLMDRGGFTGSGTRSPIRYQTVGTAPFRVFKLEFFNAGFLLEADMYNTMNDSANFQFWVYETTNIVEMHFGPSRITHPSDYFEYATNNGPVVAHFKNVDPSDLASSTGTIYYVTDAATGGTTIDTLTLPPSSVPSTLAAWPSNGTVFRFIPKSVSCPAITPNFTNTTSVLTTTFTYTGTTTGLDSLVWDFGDGRKQTVTTGFTTPLPHTYTTAGKYNVSVMAYTRCESFRLLKSGVAVSVDALATGQSSVYPNPATNVLHIDGMAAGTRATILSVLGQAVLSVTLTGDRESLDLNTLPAGTYMLQLSNGGANVSHRFTKK